jgi:phenylalanyl-tRNA synthetase beta subunit
MRRAGISQDVGMRLLGVKTPSVWRGYDVVTEEDLREDVERLSHYQRVEADGETRTLFDRSLGRSGKNKA